MAIIFHEGLPGAGKSYEAIKTICDRLKTGRVVYAHIDGLNYEKIAEVTELPVSTVEALLFPITDEQVPEIHKHVENDALVVIDELQNFFPAIRQPLSKEMTEFVTKHRHRGLDLLVMGQDYNDCHNLWKRRIDKRLVFVQLDALGLSGKYRFIPYQQVNKKWNKIGSGSTHSYDKKYFGAYKSHDDGADNKATYTEKRLTVWNSPVFKYAIPMMVVVLYFAVSTLIDFLSPPKDLQAAPVRTNQMEVKKAVEVKKPLPPAKPAPVVPVVVPDLSYIGKLAEKYRPRLSGYISSATRTNGLVEFLDDSFHVKERLTLESIREMGWDVKQKSYGLLITKKTEHYLITTWPVDPFGAVSYRTRNNVAMSSESR